MGSRNLYAFTRQNLPENFLLGFGFAVKIGLQTFVYCPILCRVKKTLLILLVGVSLLLSGCAATFSPLLLLLLKNDPATQIVPQDEEFEKVLHPEAKA